MRVAEAMTHEVRTVNAADSIQRAAQLMGEHDIGMLLVADAQGAVDGVITDRDITCRAVAEGAAAVAPVERFMSRELLSCHAQDDLYQAIELMEREQVRRLLVRDFDEKPVGVLAQADIAQAVGSYGLAGEMVHDISQPGGRHTT